jgi:hypothetical protein
MSTRRGTRFAVTRPRARLFAAPVLLSVLLLTACSSTSSRTAAPALSGPAPSALPVPALVYAALSTLCSSGSARVVETSTSVLEGTREIDTKDLTQSGGREVQAVTYQSSPVPDRLTLLFVKGVEYEQGDISALFDLGGLDKAQVDQFSGEWIAIGHGQNLGTVASADARSSLTLCGLSEGFSGIAAFTRLPDVTVGGRRMLRVESPVAPSAGYPNSARYHLYLTDARWPRLVEIELHGAGGDTDRLTFSRWDEPVRLTAPAHSVPATAVEAVHDPKGA